MNSQTERINFVCIYLEARKNYTGFQSSNYQKALKANGKEVILASTI